MVLSKKLKIILIAVTVSAFLGCDQSKNVIVDQGGQDSGGGNTSYSTEEDIVDVALNTKLVLHELLFKLLEKATLLELSLAAEIQSFFKINKSDVKSSDSFMFKDIADQIQIKFLKRPDLAEKLPLIVFLDVEDLKVLPKHTLYQEIFVKIVTQYLELENADDLIRSRSEIFIRKHSDNIFGSVFVQPYLEAERLIWLKKLEQKSGVFDKILNAPEIDINQLCREVRFFYVYIRTLEKEVELYYQSQSSSIELDGALLNMKESYQIANRTCEPLDVDQVRSFVQSYKHIISQIEKGGI